MSEWRPIETAPQDGTRILLVVAGYEVSIGRFFRLTSLGCWGRRPNHGKHEGWLTRDLEDFDSDDDLHDWLVNVGYEPTHWMPLPEPPA